MDAKTDSRTVPLSVDLDGTLIAGDLLWEQLFALIKRKPHMAFLAFAWLLSGGKARLKREVAARVDVNAALLPYRTDFVAWLREQKASGRPLILATASHKRAATAVADHLQLFDEVIASEGAVNLKGAAKRDALVRRFGEAGFDYAGNSRDDLPLFDAARRAIVVAPDAAAARFAREHDALLFPGPPVGLGVVVRMLRCHQWLKNGLIAVPLVLGHEVLDIPSVVAVLLAMIAFSATASAIYILNDIFDLEADRAHKRKRRRPFAAGQVSIPAGLGIMLALLAAAGVICLFLPPLFAVVLGAYLIATTAYSMALKRMLLIDIFTLAGLYTMRLVAGAAATGIEASFWLLAFSGFFFISLALVKRYVELVTTAVPVGERIAGRGYRTEDSAIIMQAGVASAFVATLVLALYIDSAAVRELYGNPWMIWPLAPIVLYINLRVWVLAIRNEMDEDPVVFIARDWRSQIMVVLSAGILALAASV
jgi:4-hydroxybenzoate polyprenyltransferase/phosphoserine phosphatase